MGLRERQVLSRTIPPEREAWDKHHPIKINNDFIILYSLSLTSESALDIMNLHINFLIPPRRNHE